MQLQHRVSTLGILLILPTMIVSGNDDSKAQKDSTWHPPVSAPIHYADTAVIIADGSGVACVTFHCPPTVVYGVTGTSDLVEYRFRYRANDGTETSGHGLLYEKYKSVVDGADTVVVDEGGKLTVLAGHFQLNWSQGDANMGWLYYAPENQRLLFAASRDCDKLKLKRFAQ